jgi:hypothetical protein
MAMATARLCALAGYRGVRRGSARAGNAVRGDRPAGGARIDRGGGRLGAAPPISLERSWCGGAADRAGRSAGHRRRGLSTAGAPSCIGRLGQRRCGMSASRTAGRLVRCYPRGWQARYGEELETLIVDMSGEGRVPWRVRADVAVGGGRERLVDSGCGRRAGRAERRVAQPVSVGARAAADPRRRADAAGDRPRGRRRSTGRRGAARVGGRARAGMNATTGL